MFNLFGNQENDKEDGIPETRFASIAGRLSKLLQMRQERALECDCGHCADLLELLRNKTNMLERYHQGEQPGLVFWTQSKNEGGHPSHFESQLDKKLRLTPAELTHHDEFIDSLVEVEHNWQRSQRNTCVSDDTDNFWMNHYAQLKDLISKQREQEESEESLEVLRNSIQNQGQ